MKLLELLRRQFNRLISHIAKKTGLTETRTRHACLILLAMLATLAVHLFLGHLANQRVPPLKVPEVTADAIVKGQKDIRRVEVFGVEQFGGKVTMYTFWKDGRKTITTLPRFSYGSLEDTVLMPQAVPVVYKPDEQKPGAYPVYEGFKGALISLGQSANMIFSLLLLFMMFRALGLAGNNRFTIIMPDTIDGDMDDLVGMEDIKAEVLMLADLYEKREVFASHGIKRAWNVLFSGPAGVGKTKLSGYLAKSLDVPMIFIDGSRLEDGFVGGGSRTLHKLHKKASSFGRCIVFIDEGQALLMRRGTSTRSRWEDDTPNTLLSILDGVRTKKDTEIIWIIASNFDQHTTKMDEAVLRRFQLKINFRLPNKEERKAMIGRFIGKRDTSVKTDDIDLTMVAQASSGLSPAHLEIVVDQASLIAIREQAKLDGAILLRALERTVIGLTDRAQTGHLQKEREIVAGHEAGHFVLAAIRYAESGHTLAEAKELCDTIKISTEAVSSIGALGFALNNSPEVQLFSRDDLGWKVRALYGGRAAEEILYGGTNVTTGAANDIEKATELLVQMIGAYGMHTRSPVNLLKYRGGDGAVVLSQHEQDEIRELGAKFYDETRVFILKYRNAVIRIQSRLMQDFTLDKDALFELLAADWPHSGRADGSVHTTTAKTPSAVACTGISTSLVA